MTDIDTLLSIAHEAVDLGRQLMRTMQPTATTAKGDRDIVTDVDYAVERQIRAMLAQQTPDIDFLGEEEGGRGAQAERLTWCLDPVDGTTNFAHGSPLCGISLALLDGPHAVIGVIDLPFLDLRYHATEHSGAFCGTNRIAVSTTRRLHDAVVAIGDFAVGDGAEDKNRLRVGAANRLAERAQRVRMHGSAAIDLAWLADGRVDAMTMLASNNPWDTAAGVLIAREAGAHIVDRHGQPHTTSSTDVIGANPDLLTELLDLVHDTAVASVTANPGVSSA